MYNPYAQANPTEAIRRNRMSVKGYLGSSNALAIGVLNIISIVLSLVTSIISVPFANNLMEAIYYEMDMGAPISTGFSFSIPILPILTIIAFCLLHSAGKNKNPDTPNSAGATILMVVSIINLVILCLSAVAIILLVILAIAFGTYAVDAFSSRSYYYSYGFISGYVSNDEASIIAIVLIIALVVLIGIFTLALINAIGMVRLSSSLKKGLTTPELTAKGAKAVGVCNVFYAVFSGFGIITTPITLILIKEIFYLRSSNSFVLYLILITICSVLTFVTHICLAKFAFGFNKHVQADAYTGTPYSAPVQPVAPMYGFSAEPTVPQNNPIEVNEFTPYETTSTPQQETEYIDISENPFTESADEPVAPQSTCPICGESVVPGQAFCAECGYKLN